MKRRALPRRAYLPGVDPVSARPADAPVAIAAVDAQEIYQHSEFLWGCTLYGCDFFWEAHEAWENLWRALPLCPERLHLQGMIQCAAARLLMRVGRESAAARMRTKALEKLDPVLEARWPVRVDRTELTLVKVS